MGIVLLLRVPSWMPKLFRGWGPTSPNKRMQEHLSKSRSSLRTSTAPRFQSIIYIVHAF